MEIKSDDYTVAGEVETTVLDVWHLAVLNSLTCACGQKVGPKARVRLWAGSIDPLEVYIIRCPSCGLA